MLTKSNVQNAVRLLPNYKKLVSNGSRFRVAIDRWKKSLAVKNDFDKFVEMRIAIESLFLSKNTMGKESDRLALNSAKFLFQSARNRANFYKKIRSFYYVSSQIIHGGHQSQINLKKGNLGYIQKQFKIAALKIIKLGNIPNWNYEIFR